MNLNNLSRHGKQSMHAARPCELALAESSFGALLASQMPRRRDCRGRGSGRPPPVEQTEPQPVGGANQTPGTRTALQRAQVAFRKQPHNLVHNVSRKGTAFNTPRVRIIIRHNRTSISYNCLTSKTQCSTGTENNWVHPQVTSLPFIFHCNSSYPYFVSANNRTLRKLDYLH